jgi:hypothetical protein
VKRGSTIEVDGQLGEWRDAAWMEMQARDNNSSTRNAPRPVNVRLALRWDNNRLFIAARVQEPSLQPRRPEAVSYPFWDDYDALQIAFGLRDDALAKPGREPFRDTDYGFLLSPFSDGTDDVEGRVLRLWSTTVPFGEVRDTLRWGGAVPGAQCAIVRDEANQITTYEASLPLTKCRRCARLRARRVIWRCASAGFCTMTKAAPCNGAAWQTSFPGGITPVHSCRRKASFSRRRFHSASPRSVLSMKVSLFPRRYQAHHCRCRALQRNLPRHVLPQCDRLSYKPMSPRVLPPFNVPSENVLPPAPVRNEPLPQLPPSPPE